MYLNGSLTTYEDGTGWLTVTLDVFKFYKSY